MEPDSLKWVGSSCGLHGPYVFYKAFRFHRDGRPRILSLGDFFLVRCQPEDPICIAELQLLWEERTTKQLLSSSKLYFLPEDTPNGRTVCHGEDEVVAVSEKVIVRLQDLVNWTVGDFSGWAQGKQPLCPPRVPVLREQNANGQVAPPTRRCRDPAPSCGLNFRDVQREKAQIGEDDDEDGRMKVLVLSYLQYCRYRCVLARLRGRPEEGTLSERVVRALGGLVLVTAATQVLYCRDTFQHPTLGHNQSVCEHFAPNLKGRPRKKKLSISQRKDSHNQDPTPTPTPTSTLTPTPTPIPTPTPALNPKQPPQPSSQNSSPEPKAHVKVKVNCKAVVPKPKNGAISKRGSTEEREKEKEGTKGECGEEEQAFLVGLYKYMKERKTPIERIPYLGFKQINLWTMFQAAQKRGGYEVITARRQWKHVYDELGGNPGSTSAATCTRRHYERLLLPYERCSKGQDERPLPGSRPRKQEAEGGPEGPRVRAMAPKRPRAAHSQEPPASRGKDPHSPASNESKDNRSSQQPSLQKQKRGDKKIEEEEELQLAVKKENHTDKSPVSQTNGHDNSSINETCRDKQTPQESPKLDLIEKLDRDQPKGAVPKGTLPPSHPPWQCSKPCHSSPLPWCALDPSPAREPQIHEGVVGLMASTLKQHPPRQDGVVSGLHVNAVEPSSGGEECETLLHPPLPAKVYPLVMSPLAKKKLLSQASERGEVTSDYTFNPPAPPPPSAMMSRSSMCGASEAEDPPARMKPSSDSSSPETLLLARPSVIQHAQRAKPQWGSDEQRETHQGEPPRSETLLQNGAPLQCPFQAKTWSERSSCLDSYPHRTALQDCVLEAGVKWSPSPLQEHAYKSDLYSPLVHNLYAHTAHRLTNNHHVTKCLARDPYPLGGQSVREGLTCTAKAPDGGRMGYTPSLQSEQRRESPPRDARLAEEPTDLSLPKIPPSKPVLCGPPRNMLHWDAIVPAVSADGRPTACRVSPMPITPQRLPEDSAQHGGGWGGGVVLGYKETESVRQYRDHDVKASLQTAPQALKRPLEEQEDRASSERKIRAVSPLPLSRDCASSRAAIARVTDPELEVVKPAEPAYAIHLNSYSSEGHKYRLPSPLLGGLYPATATGMFGAQEVCDRGLGLGLTPAHPLAFLKGQTAVAPLMASPFTLHTLMMQRQLLSSQPHLYRPASNAAGPYRDLLPPGLYPPLSPLNPQPAYMSTQMPSVQPGTKL